MWGATGGREMMAKRMAPSHRRHTIAPLESAMSKYFGLCRFKMLATAMLALIALTVLPFGFAYGQERPPCATPQNGPNNQPAYSYSSDSQRWYDSYGNLRYGPNGIPAEIYQRQQGMPSGTTIGSDGLEYPRAHTGTYYSDTHRE